MVNDIAVLSDNTIYLAHTSNSLIYQLKRDNNTYQPNHVVGNLNYYGNTDNDYGKKALIHNPRNIIKNREETELFFIDNNTLIKNVKIQSDSIIGNTIEAPLTDTPPNSNIYTNYGFNYATSVEPKRYIYFSSLTNLYKVYINSTEETTSSSNLPSTSNFVDISFYDNKLYYCYTTNDTDFNFKKSDDLINYDITSDDDLTLTLDSRIKNNVKGFSITSNLLLVLGSNAIQSFTTTDYTIFTSNNLKTMSESFTALIDYKAIYNDNCNFVIGRRSDYKNFYKINTDTLEIDTSGEFVVNMRNDYSINVLSEGTTQNYKINENIIYNNRYLTPDENIILHYNENLSNIQKIKCINSEFKTKRLNFTSNNEPFTFEHIVDIAINNLNTLYIATTSNIYSIDVTSGNSNNSYALTSLSTNDIITDGSSIKSIYYSDANPNTNADFLHYVTTSSYNVFNLNDTTKSIFSNIIQTDNTDSLEKLNDFVIDNNYEIGYMAFKDRLKWFYI